MKRLYFVLLINLLVLAAQAQIIGEWRGLGRTGVYEKETGLLNVWPPDGPELLWYLDSVLPSGYSSVSIAHQTIYFTGIIDTMDAMIAVSIDGKLKWITICGRAFMQSFPDSRCTPTIEGDRAYVSSGLGDVACINVVSGQIIWKVNASELYGGTYGEWGIAESPLIYENLVLFTPGGNLTTMIALDKLTGNLVWKSKSLEDNPSYTSPLLIKRGNLDVVVQVTEHYVFAINPKTGDILWKFNFGQFAAGEWLANIHTNTPVYDDNCLYVTSGYDHKAVMLQLTNDSSQVYFKWADSVLDVHHGGVVKLGNYLYGSNWLNNRAGNWVCIDWRTGQKMYQAEWFTKGSIVAADGKLICYEEKTGNVALVDAKPQGFNVISTFKVPYGSGPHWSHPVINNGIMYLRHGKALMAYKIKEN